MKFSLNNFLMASKQIVTGGGYEKDAVTPRNDAGFLVDNSWLLGDSTLPASHTYTTDSSGFPIISVAATVAASNVVPFWVPRDYDEATDEIHFRFIANMGGATDTPTLTVTPKFRIAGSAAVAFSPASQTTAALSATQVLFDFVWRSQGLKRDTLTEFTFSSTAHGTDAIQIASIGVAYRSTMVSYHETDGTRDGKDGNVLR